MRWTADQLAAAARGRKRANEDYEHAMNVLADEVEKAPEWVVHTENNKRRLEPKRAVLKGLLAYVRGDRR